MKILHLISSLGNGGAEKFVVELANQMAIDNDVTICCFKKVELWMEFPKHIVPKVKVISTHKKTGFDISMFHKLYRIIKLEKPNIVHFHLDATIKYILPFVLFFPSIKFVHTLHSDVNLEKIKIFKQLKKVNFILKKVRLVSIASSLQKDFSALLPKHNISLIENGIAPLVYSPLINDVESEIKKLKKNTNTLVAITVGRLDENKNQELIINAFKNYQNSILIIIGNDPSLAKTYLTKLNSIKSNNIHIIGSKTNVADYLAQADVFILSSKNEGLPISVLEAMSVGLPIITTPAGGLKSIIINNTNGFITTDFTIESMEQAIFKYSGLYNDDKNIIKNNSKIEFNQKYNITTCCSKYLNLYNT